MVDPPSLERGWGKSKSFISNTLSQRLRGQPLNKVRQTEMWKIISVTGAEDIYIRAPKNILAILHLYHKCLCLGTGGCATKGKVMLFFISDEPT